MYTSSSNVWEFPFPKSYHHFLTFLYFQTKQFYNLKIISTVIVSVVCISLRSLLPLFKFFLTIFFSSVKWHTLSFPVFYKAPYILPPNLYLSWIQDIYLLYMSPLSPAYLWLIFWISLWHFRWTKIKFTMFGFTSHFIYCLYIHFL